MKKVALLLFLSPLAMLLPFISRREAEAESHSFRLQEISPVSGGFYDMDFLSLNSPHRTVV